MTQHLMVKPEIASSAASSTGANKASATDNAEVQPFSSELNKQIDKHAKTQDQGHEQGEQSTKTHTAKQQDKSSKAEIKDDKDGKNLPKEAHVDAEPKNTEHVSDDIVDDEVIVSSGVIVSSDNVDSLTEIDVVKEVDVVTVVENDGAEIINAVVTADKDIKPTVTVAKNGDSESKTTKQAIVKAQTTSVLSTKVAEVELPETNKNSAVTQALLDARKNGENKIQGKENIAVELKNVEDTLSDKKSSIKPPVINVAQARKQPQQSVVVKQEQAVAALTLSKTQLQQQEITAPSKGLAQNAVEGLSSDQKKQATALRPDILYGINKKYSAENGNVKLELPIATEKVMTSERIATKAVSEGSLMADIVKQVKPGLQYTAPTVERGGLALGSAVSTYTPAGAVSQGQTAATVTTPILDIQPALQTTAWNRVMSGRVVWMAREGVQQAELKLNPASLGPVEVRLNMNNDQTSVTFIANHAATRDALEQALPRLRESFSENGMELADAEVMQHSAEEQHQDDTTEADGSTAQNEQAKVDSEELSGEEQQKIDEQSEAGLSLYA
jgi:flagellar hook-length control protein FliK